MNPVYKTQPPKQTHLSCKHKNLTLFLFRNVFEYILKICLILKKYQINFFSFFFLDSHLFDYVKLEYIYIY